MDAFSNGALGEDPASFLGAILGASVLGWVNLQTFEDLLFFLLGTGFATNPPCEFQSSVCQSLNQNWILPEMTKTFESAPTIVLDPMAQRTLR